MRDVSDRSLTTSFRELLLHRPCPIRIVLRTGNGVEGQPSTEGDIPTTRGGGSETEASLSLSLSLVVSVCEGISFCEADDAVSDQGNSFR